MTVKELIDAAPFCDSAEIIVREHGSGKWIQGYRIGSKIDQFPCECTVEFREAKDGTKYAYQRDGRHSPAMTKSEIRDVLHGAHLPMKLIKKDVSKLPENVANLQVCSFQPRHIPSFHREQMTHNEFNLDINAYPEGFVPEVEEKAEVSKDLEGQMDIMDFLGGAAE